MLIHLIINNINPGIYFSSWFVLCGPKLLNVLLLILRAAGILYKYMGIHPNKIFIFQSLIGPSRIFILSSNIFPITSEATEICSFRLNCTLNLHVSAEIEAKVVMSKP